MDYDNITPLHNNCDYSELVTQMLKAGMFEVSPLVTLVKAKMICIYC